MKVEPVFVFDWHFVLEGYVGYVSGMHCPLHCPGEPSGTSPRRLQNGMKPMTTLPTWMPLKPLTGRWWKIPNKATIWHYTNSIKLLIMAHPSCSPGSPSLPLLQPRGCQVYSSRTARRPIPRLLQWRRQRWRRSWRIPTSRQLKGTRHHMPLFLRHASQSKSKWPSWIPWWKLSTRQNLSANCNWRS